tara:strand:+ start:1604 stop:2482 length:879 start_codon:yes stop_codon:yes gene_type:complete
MENWNKIADQKNLTEGPTWIEGKGLLYSECSTSLTWFWDFNKKTNKVWRNNSGGSNGMILDVKGKLYACEGEARRVVSYIEGEETEILSESYNEMPFNEPNDLAIHPNQKIIWFSDPNYGGRELSIPHESVYLLKKKSEKWLVERVTFDTDRPNGVLLSKDLKRLYVANSPHDFDNESIRRELRSYIINSNFTLGDYEVMHDFGPARGVDGMTLDSMGNIVATAGFEKAGPGPMIYYIEPDGRVIKTFKAPEDSPTNCTFGGDELDTLYVTFATGAVYELKNSGLYGLKKRD